MKCEKHKGMVNMTPVEFPADNCPYCNTDQLRQEVETLKAERDAFERDYLERNADAATYFQRSQKAEAERDRYREVLGKIAASKTFAEHKVFNAVYSAREALKEVV